MLVWNKFEQIIGNPIAVLAAYEQERLQTIVLQVI